MDFKILFVKRIPREDLSLAITSKFDSFERHMLFSGDMNIATEEDDYFAYYMSAKVTDAEDAKLFIYAEREDVENVGNKGLSVAVDNLKVLCEMYDFPHELYLSPMENMEKVVAIKDICRLIPEARATVSSAFGLSEAESDTLDDNTISNDIADIPEDTEFIINNQTSVKGNMPDSYLDKPNMEDIEPAPEIKRVGSIDLDVLADKIAARMNNKASTTSKPTTPTDRGSINLGNILRGKTESIYEWAIRVFLSNPEVESDATELHTKIQGLIFKSLSYTYKAVESSVVKETVASSTPVTEVEKTPVPTPEPEVRVEKDGETVETTKSIYTDSDDITKDIETSEESIFTDDDPDDKILLEAAEMSENDSEFFNYIKNFKDELSQEALDSVARYNMYYKITTGESVENSFVVYTKRKTALGL